MTYYFFISIFSTSYSANVVTVFLSMPQALVALPCESRSINNVFLLKVSRAADRFTAVVVFPVPPANKHVVINLVMLIILPLHLKSYNKSISRL